MTDRELLELAAKAAGVCLHTEVTHSYGNWGCDTTCVACGEEPSGRQWKPLTDDGDAFRLAAKLMIDVEWPTLDVVFADGNFCEQTSDHGGDRATAVRRAIVRAAAYIGEDM